MCVSFVHVNHPGRVTGVRPGSAKATVAACVEGLEGKVIRKDTHNRWGLRSVPPQP